MGEIVTSVPNDFVPPQTFHQFNYLRAGSGRRSIPLNVALIATKAAGGTGVVGQVYEVSDAAVTDVLAGASSEGAMMARQALLCRVLFGRGPRVVMTFITAPAGVANVQLITCVGAATADGNQIFRVAGRTFVVGVRTGDSANTIAAAISNKLKERQAELPVIVSVATNVVTLTHPHAGVNGKDVIVTCDQQVAGDVATVSTSVVGTGAADITPGLAALSPLRYDGIVTANHAAADVSAALLDLAVRWGADSKTWGWYYIGEPGTIGTATALAGAANERAIIVSNQEGNLNSAGEMATTSALLTFSRSRPNSSFDGAVVPLYPPAAGTIYTRTEVNTAIKAGLTVYTGVIDAAGSLTTDRSRCEQMVTTKTLLGGFPDDRNRDIAVSRTGVYLAIQLDAAVAELRENNPDGLSQSRSKPLLRDLGAAILRAEARANPPVLNRDFIESDVESIIVEEDDVTLGRNNVKLPYHPDIPLHQVVWVHDVIVGV